MTTTAKQHSTYLIGYYTKAGDIHFAWIVRATSSTDARQQVSSLRNFREVITCDESYIHPLNCPSSSIHMVR